MLARASEEQMRDEPGRKFDDPEIITVLAVHLADRGAVAFLGSPPAASPAGRGG